MRRLIINEEQFKALQFAVGDAAEVYSTYVVNNPDENEQEYMKKVREHGKILKDLYERDFKE